MFADAALDKEFQSTPLREGRLYGSGMPIRFSMFQSTPLREGRPKTKDMVPSLSSVSIHAPPRGATYSLISVGSHLRCFNPRPSARGAPTMGSLLDRDRCFNPRPSARGDVI